MNRLVTTWRGLSRARQLLHDGHMGWPAPRWASLPGSSTIVAEDSSNDASDLSSDDNEPGAQVAASTSIIPIRCPLQSMADDPLADLEPGTQHREEAILPGGTSLKLEAGAMAVLADGACTARIGDAVVLATAQAPRSHWKQLDLSQRLSVVYRHRPSASAQLPRNIHRKSLSSTDDELVKVAVVQRALRGLLPRDFGCPVTIKVTVLSLPNAGPLMLTVLHAASAALACSDIPCSGPVAAVALTYKNGSWVAGVEEGRHGLPTMVLVANEGGVITVDVQGDSMTPSMVSEGVNEGFKHVHPILEAQHALMRAVGRSTRTYPPSMVDSAAMGVVDAMTRPALQELFATSGLSVWQREQMMGVVHAELLAKLKERGLLRNAYVRVRNSGLLTQTDAQQALPMVQQNVLADMLAHEGLRLDGRSALDARPVTVEAGPLPVVHGSVLVSQGSSQVLAVCTLDNLFPSEPRNAINIIPDLSRLGNDWSGKRHSAQERIDACVSQTVLAREASRSMITPRIPTTPTRPTIDKFPLAVKIDCDVLADDGGTVPLSVTANSLVMRAAGVPLGKPVAGVQVGLLAPADESAALSPTQLVIDPTDIESSFSPLDMQVIGTADGLSKIELGMVSSPLPVDVLDSALNEAANALQEVLESLPESIPTQGHYAVIPFPSDVVFTMLQNRLTKLRLSGDMVLKQYVRYHLTPNSVAVYAANRRAWEWFQQQLQIATDNASREHDPANIGKTYEVLVQRLMSNGVQCQFASGKVVNMSLAEASLEPVLSGKDLDLEVGESINVVFVGLDRDGEMILSRKAALVQADGKDEQSKL